MPDPVIFMLCGAVLATAPAVAFGLAIGRMGPAPEEDDDATR